MGMHVVIAGGGVGVILPMNRYGWIGLACHGIARMEGGTTGVFVLPLPPVFMKVFILEA